MEASAVRTRVKTIEESLIYSVRLLARMDSSAGVGGVLLISDIFIWTLEQLNPLLIKQLRDLDLLDTFRRRLAQYQELRRLAEPLRFANHLRAEAEICTDLHDVGYLRLDDIQYALDDGDWHPDDRSARLCFLRVLRIARAMPYPVDEMDTAFGTPQPFRAADALTGMGLEATCTEDTSSSLNAQMPETLDTALEHIRRELFACDDGGADWYWACVYSSVLGGWLQEDSPEQATKVLAAGHVEAFFDELARFIDRMRQAERVWNEMGRTVRTLALRADEPTLSLVISEFVRADETEENEVPAWTSLLRNMVKRRGLREMSDEHAVISDIAETLETSTVVEKIRCDSNVHRTCYLISRDDLPSSFRAAVEGGPCLAIRLPEERLEIADSLAQATSLDCFYSQTTGPNPISKLQLCVNRAFWCTYGALWPILFRFRRAIPVLYIFERKCILVRYPFAHFSDLRSIAEQDRYHRNTVYICDGSWTDTMAQESVDVLRGGTQLKPAMLDRVVDLSEHTYANSLADAYKTIRSAKHASG